MNPRMQFAFYALWIGHPVLHSAVAVVMLRRKLHRAFPVFFRYILSQIVLFAIVFPLYMHNSYRLFFYVYATCIGISAAYGFKVIYEVFLDVFRPYHTLKDLGSVLFMWAGLVMLLVAGVVAAASSSADEAPLWQAVMTGQRCVRVVQVGLIIFLLIFSRYLGVSRRQLSFGIALGFGGFACVELMLVAMRTSGFVSENFASLANMVAYNGAIGIWLTYVALPTKGRSPSAGQLMSQRWDQSLSDLQHPVAPESLIPMFECMVDRAFSRTQDDHVVEEGVPAASHHMSAVEGGDFQLPPNLPSKL